jgi:hypothetical protein
LKKSDYVLICGDFGGVWNGRTGELYCRAWLDSKPFTTLFIDGNHENFDLLNAYPVQQWNGGKVHFVTDSIIHPMRGQVFTIEGKTIFTMGGASSVDKALRREGVSWWKDELPSEAEYEEALKNLDACGWRVDYIVTHTVPARMLRELRPHMRPDPLNLFLDIVQDKLGYSKWFSGHLHEDREINEKYVLKYQDVERVI